MDRDEMKYPKHINVLFLNESIHYPVLLHLHSSPVFEATQRQSARLFLQSSELGSPTPSHAGEFVLFGSGDDTLASRRVVGGPNLDEGHRHCVTLGTSIYVLRGAAVLRENMVND
jgi:hypothetical protein